MAYDVPEERCRPCGSRLYSCGLCSYGFHTYGRGSHGLYSHGGRCSRRGMPAQWVSPVLISLRDKVRTQLLLPRELVPQRLQAIVCFGVYSYGLHGYVLYSHGLYSYGLYSYGLYSNGSACKLSCALAADGASDAASLPAFFSEGGSGSLGRRVAGFGAGLVLSAALSLALYDLLMVASLLRSRKESTPFARIWPAARDACMPSAQPKFTRNKL